MTDTINIEKKRGDTKRHTFTVYEPNGVDVKDISAWTQMILTVDPEKSPVDDTNNVARIVGALTIDGLDGKMSFIPTGAVAVGRYFYDVQAIDENNESTTTSEGKYKITQDISQTYDPLP